MKIGTFARENKQSIDAIRHYMDLGLLVPLKEGAHYRFDEVCQKDLQHLLQLKEMGFALKDIQRIFSMIRMGAATPKREAAYIISQFEQRIEEIENEEAELKLKKERVVSKMNDLKELDVQSEVSLSVQLRHLDLLYCPRCDQPFKAEDALIQKGGIVNGRLICTCGNELLIDNGIVMGEAQMQQRYNKMLLDAETMYEDYVERTDPSFLDHLYATMEWMRKKINLSDQKPTVLLDLGVGAGMFFRHMCSDLRDVDLYIGIDHDLERLELLRDVYESSGNQPPLLLICCDFLKMPLKRHLADVVVDLSGSLHYAFDHPDPLIPKVTRWFKNEAFIVGAYLVFDHLYHHLDTGIECASVFNVEGILGMMEQSGVRCIDAEEGPIVKAGGKYEEMHQAGKNMRGYRYYGQSS